MQSPHRNLYIRPRYALIWRYAGRYSREHDVPLSTMASEGLRLYLQEKGIEAPYTKAT